MFAAYEELLEYCQKQNIRMFDFKIVDISGRWRHLSIPADRLTPEVFETGFGFDGSNYGYSKIENSDMVYIPDLSTAFYDPFWEEKTLSFLGNIYEITGEEPVLSSQDPRSILQKALLYLKQTGIADQFVIGPEFEFYLFDGVRYINEPQRAMFQLDSLQAGWMREGVWPGETPALGYTVRQKDGYHVDAPYDRYRDLRSKICLALEENGVRVKYHHHEVGGPGQQEIELTMGEAGKLADQTLLVKYFIKNMAYKHGKAATFMAKPLQGEAGSGFHVHMQLLKGKHTVFASADGYRGLSREALYFMGGVLRHTPALMGLAAPSTNSYKRLINGYEAPVAICFGSSNRSAVIRIPGYAREWGKRRFEFRAPDAAGNPYLTFAALLLAGLDGIKNRIDPVEAGYGPVEKNIYELTEKEKIGILPQSLEEAIQELEQDHSFLLVDDIFTSSFLENWMRLKRKEASLVRHLPHPKEFELYFDL